MIQALWFVGGRTGRAWIREMRPVVRRLVPRRWRASSGRPDVSIASPDARILLRRLQAESGAIVERALAARVEPPVVPGGARAVRLRAATVAHFVGASWRIGIRDDEAGTLAAAGSLVEIESRLGEAMARHRRVEDASTSPAFHRRLALLDVVSDAAHPGVRREHELEPLRRARVEEEVARRREAAERVEQLQRELSRHAELPTGDAHEAARRLLSAQWQRLANAPLSSTELHQRVEELAEVYRRFLLPPGR